jgi:hypothetical protein
VKIKFQWLNQITSKVKLCRAQTASSLQHLQHKNAYQNYYLSCFKFWNKLLS